MLRTARRIRRQTRRLVLRAAFAGLGLGFASSVGAAPAAGPAAPPDRAAGPAAAPTASDDATARPASGDADRAWVLVQPAMARELYLDGTLTDSRGNRWEVAVVPGVRPPLREGAAHWREAGRGLGRAGKAMGEAGRALTDYGDGAFWMARAETAESALRFAADDALVDTVIVGVPEGLAGTARAVRETAEEKPFAWMPRVAARATWGFVLEPVARTGLGLGGAGLGVTWAAVGPPLETTGPLLRAGGRTLEATARTTWALGADGLVAGTLAPAGALAAHQPLWLLAVLGPEPLPRHDGRFGLHLVAGPDRVHGPRPAR